MSLDMPMVMFSNRHEGVKRGMAETQHKPALGLTIRGYSCGLVCTWEGGHRTTEVPPPLAQAQPRSQKSRQNNGSTPTPCLDRAMHARNIQILPVLIHCRGHQVPAIEAPSNPPPHLEQWGMLALWSWFLSRFCGRLRE